MAGQHTTRTLVDVGDWRGRLGLVGAALAVLALASPASASNQVIARPGGSTTVTAFGDTILWSTRGEDGRFRLTARTGTDDRTLPVPAAGYPFTDADLGPGPDGALWAVYSRCEDADDRVAGCDLYGYDFATEHEIRLDAVSAPDADEHSPSIWGDRIAFARRAAHPAVGRPAERVFIGRLDGATPPKGVPMYSGQDFPRGAPEFTEQSRYWLKTFAVIGLDLQGDTIALAWETYGNSAMSYASPPGNRHATFRGEHYGQHGTLAFDPSLSDRWLVYQSLWQDYSEGGLAAARVDTRTGRKERLDLPATVSAITQFGDALLEVKGSAYENEPCSTCTIELDPAPPWKPVHPQKR
jgi:hypothetical protein